MEYVVLVDEFDNEIGVMEKMLAHKKGVRHRAFSVFLFNSKGEMLLQQRAREKYHSGGLWTNACCGHPRQNESVIGAAHRRLMEEMGFDCCISKAFKLIYKMELDKSLIEHELDHVFIGEYGGEVNYNGSEVEAYKYVDVKQLLLDVEQHPKEYTEWFKICLKEMYPRVRLGVAL